VMVPVLSMASLLAMPKPLVFDIVMVPGAVLRILPPDLLSMPRPSVIMRVPPELWMTPPDSLRMPLPWVFDNVMVPVLETEPKLRMPPKVPPVFNIVMVPELEMLLLLVMPSPTEF